MNFAKKCIYFDYFFRYFSQFDEVFRLGFDLNICTSNAAFLFRCKLTQNGMESPKVHLVGLLSRNASILANLIGESKKVAVVLNSKAFAKLDLEILDLCVESYP